jgi:iron complex outermembrane receptor protein
MIIGKTQTAFMLLFGFLLSFPVKSQTDTTLLLKQVEVKASKITQKSPGSFIQTLRKELLAIHPSGSLNQLLSGGAGLFFRTYGQGSLATSTVRGGGANHTAILWNGFNLQNPMNGVADFSLFPVWLTNEVSIQLGGGSSLQGSGVLGGVVFIDNRAALKQDVEGTIGSTIGSFGEFRQYGKLSLGGNRMAGALNILHQQADNDYPLPGQNSPRQVNAGNNQWAISQNNTLKINEKQKLSSFLWWQKSGRDIPPSLVETNSHARQEDEVARLGLEWSRLGNRSLTKARAGYFNEKLLFFSDWIDSTESRSATWMAEVEQAFFHRKNHILRAGLNFTRQQAETIETGNRQRTRMGLFASWRRDLMDEELTLSLDGRQEWVDDGFIPPVGAAGIEWQLHPAWSVHGRVAKNFNLPTFNDLYWKDAYSGGNPDLKPETAWGQEAGLGLHREIRRVQITSRLTLFNNQVKNWILWAPNGNIWQPQNLRTVRARGLEHFVEISRRSADSTTLFTMLRFNWSYSRSTVEKIYEQHDPNQIGKQLIYTPSLNAGVLFTMDYRQFNFYLQHIITGKRYTSPENDEASALPSFQTSDLGLGKTWRLLKGQLRTQLTIGNVFNVDYQAIAFRPMPGRHFRVDVVYGF